MTKIKTYYFCCLFLGSFFLTNKLTLAQENKRGFSLDPSFQEVNINPEQKESQFFLTVENATENTEIFRISVLDFGSLDELGGIAFLGASDLERKYGLASWISLEKDVIVIDPSEKQQVRVTIENKESLSPGGHYAALFLKMESKERLAGSKEKPLAVAFNPSLASLIFARKLGGEIYGMEFKSREWKNNLWKNPTNIKIRFQNTGNMHVVPRGIIRISDPLGREVMRGIINQESAIILPETFRFFSVSLKNMVPTIFPGNYTISVEYRYDGKDDFSIDSSKFIFIPPLSMVIGLILLAGIVRYIKYIKSMNKKNKEEKNK